jgi:hypothetical protein
MSESDLTLSRLKPVLLMFVCSSLIQRTERISMHRPVGAALAARVYAGAAMSGSELTLSRLKPVIPCTYIMGMSDEWLSCRQKKTRNKAGQEIQQE